MNEISVLKENWKDAKIEGAELVFGHDENGFSIGWEAVINGNKKYSYPFWVPTPDYKQDLMDAITLGFKEVKRDILSGRIK